MPDGKICYVEIPATDAEVAAAFYSQVFGWNTRLRGDGHRAFDDTTGAVSGSWVAGRSPAREPGLLMYVMVDRIDTHAREGVGGGRSGRDAADSRSVAAGRHSATFRDPTGNLLGLYQEPRR
jgi:predicted enzyme related to lactoylglutathione lyase